jgi:hypothetical protein
LQLLGVELITQADVEDAGHDCIDPVLGVPVRHQLHTVRDLDPDRVRSVLRGSANNNRETRRGWKCCERLPLDGFGQNCPKRSLTRLMGSNCASRWSPHNFYWPG